MNNGDDSHAMVGIIDPVDHALGATTCAVSIVKGRSRLPTRLRIVEQRHDNQLVRGKRDRLRQRADSVICRRRSRDARR